MIMLRVALVLSLLCGLILAGCGGDGTAAVQPQEAPGASETGPVGQVEQGVTQCVSPVIRQPDGTYAKLSDTGLYCDIGLGTIDQDARYFAPGIGLWIDGADKKRYMRLPPGTKIDSADMDNWIFPVGMKVWKEISLNGKKIETRMLEKRPNNTWLMVAFQWNSQQSEAYPAPSGGVSNANGTSHDIPSTGQCRECHSHVADALIGVSPLMLEGASMWGVTLFNLIARGGLTQNPVRVIQFPGNQQTRDALAYLYANCSGCHRGATAPEGLDLSTSVWDLRPEDTAVYRTAVDRTLTTWWWEGFLLRVDPGSPELSGLLARMSTRDSMIQMPEIGTEIVDPTGVTIIRDWIKQLP